MKTASRTMAGLTVVVLALWCTAPASATILTFSGQAGTFNGGTLYEEYGDSVTVTPMSVFVPSAGVNRNFQYSKGNEWTPLITADYSRRNNDASQTLYLETLYYNDNWYAGGTGYGAAVGNFDGGKIAEIALTPDPAVPWAAVKVNSFNLFGWGGVAASMIQILNDDRSVVLWSAPNQVINQNPGAIFSPNLIGDAGETLRIQFSAGGMAFDNVNFDQWVVPEPGSLALLALGGLCLLRRRR